jgi:putative ABC transport system ATP-binding protein
MHETKALIVAEGVSKIVRGPDGEIRILDRIDLAVFPGESVAIVGASGSGKTTLLALLAGLDRPSGGEIVFAGRRLAELDEEGLAALRLAHVGFVFQSFHLLPHLDVEENVALPLELRGQRDPERVRAALEAVGLGARRRHLPRTLSGGEQQRVAIARAFVNEPSLLFADEPTGNLDRETGRRIGELLFGLNQKRRTTLLLVTHDRDLAARCDRVLSLRGGRLHGEATA